MLIKNNLQSAINPKWSKNHNINIPSETNNLVVEHNSNILKRLDNKKVNKKITN